MLCGLEMAVKGFTETNVAQIRQDCREIKELPINEAGNRRDAMNNRMKEAKEQIIDTEDKVIEGGQAEQKRKKDYAKQR